MELVLSKIYRHGEDNSMVHMSVEATYGWKGEMVKDTIQINYNGKKREAFITAKLLNPGVGLILEKMAEVITGVNYAGLSVTNPPLVILEVLAEKILLRYDERNVRRILS
ncbi:MAG: hypothetical protein JW807_13700 [Spirochaetes bacterium]|nr:hypothetical protein [Spirochaetota bacterium]